VPFASLFFGQLTLGDTLYNPFHEVQVAQPSSAKPRVAKL